jgi:hypothetical protein
VDFSDKQAMQLSTLLPRVARNPSRVAAKREDHFLQADFPVLIRPTSSNAVSG